MLGNFEYCNPTKLYFGEQALDGLRKELPKYGKNILLVYGGGSIQKNGIYDQVVSILQECGKTIVEDAGVMPNPTVEKLKEGCERARAGKVDFILADRYHIFLPNPNYRKIHRHNKYVPSVFPSMRSVQHDWNMSQDRNLNPYNHHYTSRFLQHHCRVLQHRLPFLRL